MSRQTDHVPASQPIALRPFGPADVSAVHAIEVAASRDPWTASLFADEVSEIGKGSPARTDRHWLVATVEDHPVGFGGLLFVADEAHVMNLAVDPSHQRRGIAARLLAALLADGADRGAISATLEVRASNVAARGLYTRFGFSDAGMRPRYYADGEDAIIMWAHRIYTVEYRDLLDELGRTG